MMTGTKLFLIFSLASAVGLFAEGGGDTFGNWGNLTALGIVAVVIVFIVTKMLPDLHGKFVDQSKVFAATIEAMQGKFSEILDKMHARNAEQEKEHLASLSQVAKEVAELRVNCTAFQARGPHGDITRQESRT